MLAPPYTYRKAQKTVTNEPVRNTTDVFDPEFFLAFMRDVAKTFAQTFLEGKDDLVFQNGGTDVLDAKLESNARLVVGLAERLGPSGLGLLTPGERESLHIHAGFASRALAAERPEGVFSPGTVYMLTVLCREDGKPGTLFTRICERLEAEAVPRILAQRHIDALDELLGRSDILRRYAESKAQLLIDEHGVKLEVYQLFVHRRQWQKVLTAAFTMLDIGVKGGFPTNGAFLYSLGFRAKLDAT